MTDQGQVAAKSLAEQRRSNRRQLFGVAAAIAFFGGAPIIVMLVDLSK